MLEMLKDRKVLIQVGVFFLLGAAVIVQGSGLLSGPYQYQGSVIDPPLPAADFDLPSTRGGHFQLSEEEGDVVLLFFGFTHCPDVCPTTLNDYQQIKARLGEEAAEVEFVFLTVDPERDTLAKLEEYLDYFDPEFVGLSAPAEALEPVWEAYGVYHQKREVGSAGGYLIDHTARIYVINTAGELQLTFPQGMAPEAMAEDIDHLLEEG